MFVKGVSRICTCNLVSGVAWYGTVCVGALKHVYICKGLLSFIVSHFLGTFVCCFFSESAEYFVSEPLK